MALPHAFVPMLHLLMLMTASVVSCQKNIEQQSDPVLTAIVGGDAQTYTILKYSVSPKTADPATTTAISDHMAFFNTNPARKNVLYVFLPGTYRNPTVCQATPMKAASIGYHAIGLMYDNLIAGNPLCKETGDTTCHCRARLEVIDGTDRGPGVNVNLANSLNNRLYKLLLYLNKANPSQNWGQYIQGDAPAWRKIIIAGHSQGGAVAGVIGKYYPVKRVIMYSMIDFLTDGKIPNWEANATNREKYFALINPLDEQVPYAKVIPGWNALGMSAYGSPTNADIVPFPYHYSHTLITTVTPNTTLVDKYHNGTGVDAYIPKDATGKYIYDKAWEYLIDAEMPVSNQPPVANAGGGFGMKLSEHLVPLLNGIASSDPDGSIRSMAWTKISGPSTCSIARPDLAQTEVTFSETGIYVFKLTVTDNLGAVATDTKDILVSP